MTPVEYVQLKAFARQDGLLLAVLWIVSFACYVYGVSNPLWSMMAIVLIVVTPFFAAKRLRKFRDEDREGSISLLRGWAYVAYMFFYASLLFALAQYVYFAFLDKGFLFASLQSTIMSAEGQQMLARYGMQDAVDESLRTMQSMRPIDYVLNMLTMNIAAGFVLGVPIAAMMKKTKIEN